MTRPSNLSSIRERQRSHAKLRLLQRFDIRLNRDGIRKIERKIASGQVVVIGSKDGRRNYFVEVEGKLMVVGYAPSTQRVVTVLPETYLENLPTELVTRARFTLLQSVRKQVIAAIAAGEATLIGEAKSVQFYEVVFEEVQFKVGYRPAEERLVPYRPK